MSQASSLIDCRVAVHQRLVGITKTEKHVAQIRPRDYARVDIGVMKERVARVRIIKRKHLFQMGSRWPETAEKPQASTGRQVRQNEATRITALAAYAQQFLVQAVCQIELAVDQMMQRLCKGNPKELRRTTQ